MAVEIKRWVRGLAGRAGYEVIGPTTRGELAVFRHCAEHAVDLFDLVITYLRANSLPCTFMQIGANDGQRNDDFRQYIERYDLPGLLVEPQPQAFARLVENYRDRRNLCFENAAIARSAGVMKLFAFNPDCENGRPLDVFTTPDRSYIEQVRINQKLSAEILTLTVPAVTIEQAMQKHGLDTVAMFVIDTEGFDYQIVKMIDLPRLRPMLIQFEHVTLPRRQHELCCRHLSEHGYNLLRARWDTVAVRPSLGRR